MFKSLFLQVLPLALAVAVPLGHYNSNGVVGRDAASADSSDVVSFLVDMLQQRFNVAGLIGTVTRTLSVLKDLLNLFLLYDSSGSPIQHHLTHVQLYDGCCHDRVRR
jgi:hypothetical protein